jgi:multiple sugar transport system substrate-binding protein
MVIPKNAKRKDLSWEFIKHLSSAESALKMALNGNGPTRGSVFTESAFKDRVPYAELVRLATLEARSQYPAFDKVGELQPLINEYIERAMLGDMEPKAACEKLAQEMDKLSEQLKLK